MCKATSVSFRDCTRWWFASPFSQSSLSRSLSSTMFSALHHSDSADAAWTSYQRILAPGQGPRRIKTSPVAWSWQMLTAASSGTFWQRFHTKDHFEDPEKWTAGKGRAALVFTSSCISLCRCWIHGWSAGTRCFPSRISKPMSTRVAVACAKNGSNGDLGKLKDMASVVDSAVAFHCAGKKGTPYQNNPCSHRG